MRTESSPLAGVPPREADRAGAHSLPEPHEVDADSYSNADADADSYYSDADAGTQSLPEPHEVGQLSLLMLILIILMLS